MRVPLKYSSKYSQKHLVQISDNKLNFQEHLKNTLNILKVLIVLYIENIKLLGYYVNCKTFCHVNHYQQFIKRLSDLILITVMLFMINTIIILSTKN